MFPHSKVVACCHTSSSAVITHPPPTEVRRVEALPDSKRAVPSGLCKNYQYNFSDKTILFNLISQQKLAFSLLVCYMSYEVSSLIRPKQNSKKVAKPL